jgi:tetratricopeptide (TPR) repeat protein
MLFLVVVGAILWGGWKWLQARRYRRAMATIAEQMENGLHSLAANNLAALLAWNPSSAEALYLLGTCEMARGRPEAAALSWARIPPSSAFAPQALARRVQLQMDRGRLADAEQIVDDAADRSQSGRSALRLLLGPIYLPQGRVEETLRLIEARWQVLDAAGEGASDEAVKLLRAHINIRLSPDETGVIRAALERGSRLAPRDDRIWLGKANQLIRDGSYDEAARWLEACAKKRPGDLAIWRARLTSAMKTHHTSEVREALTQLPAEESTPAEVQKLAAWLAAQRGDLESERQSLERLIAADPADFATLDRLADLAVTNGQPARLREIRCARAKTEKDIARYRQLNVRHQPRRDAEEMSRLAERLGQSFEAEAFLTVAVAADPDRADLRRDLAGLQRRIHVVAPGRTLAQLLAAEFPAEAR